MATIDKQYLYSIGRVKELEKGLLIQTHLARILEAENPLAVLRSLGFFRTSDDHERQESIDELFERERKQNRTLLHELIAESPLEDVFLLPFDFENIKLYVKAKLTGNAALKDLALEEGKFRKQHLFQAIFENTSTDIPAVIMDDIKAITEEFQTNQRFAPIDARLHWRLRTLQLDLARRAKSAFLVEYLQRLSDTQNISTTFRRKFHQLGRETLAAMLLDTGTLAPGFFERVYDGGWESLAAAFRPTPYGELAAAAIADLRPETFLPTLDVLCANFMLGFLRTTKQMSTGIEPILAFYLAREQELRMVQTILAGKRFGYAQDNIQQRMRELYS
ncbi:ATP synthase, subunit C [Candidatus Vecturithrix granuli]|uniref:ATP synthase, subunit C n=1 Tax=Vecturithrix granuli TaxID=1499967 RepID=A0A081C5L9_VECG1|nr:ATP synthase, subunit C [Candidatus Vecturithrix granuli]